MSRKNLVGQGQAFVYYYYDGVRYELKPLIEVAEKVNYSESHLRFMADVGEIIATKIGGRWFVDKELIKR